MTAILARLIRLGRRRHQPTDLGFGYSREPDTTPDTVPVPDGVELIFLTGRTPRGAR